MPKTVGVAVSNKSSVRNIAPSAGLGKQNE